MIQSLLRSGADQNKVKIDGKNPLDIDCLDIVKVLKHAGSKERHGDLMYLVIF